VQFATQHRRLGGVHCAAPTNASNGGRSGRVSSTRPRLSTCSIVLCHRDIGWRRGQGYSQVRNAVNQALSTCTLSRVAWRGGGWDRHDRPLTSPSVLLEVAAEAGRGASCPDRTSAPSTSSPSPSTSTVHPMRFAMRSNTLRFTWKQTKEPRSTALKHLSRLRTPFL
jgi:hypothetical protein